MTSQFDLFPEKIIKRNGSLVSFDASKIADAIKKCFANCGAAVNVEPQYITQKVLNVIAATHIDQTPTVESVQDIVEVVLQSEGLYDAAKHYILYRYEHEKQRSLRQVPENVKQAFRESQQYFPTPIQQFQFYNKYSRYSWDLGRRETWTESIDRAVNFLKELSENKLSNSDYEEIRTAMLNMDAMSSMRLLAMAGDAARRNHIGIYNCSFLPVDSVDSFVEALTISMAGCGVGYSVESVHVDKLPTIKVQSEEPESNEYTTYGTTPYVVEDSAEGWSEAVKIGLTHWFNGSDITFDFSMLRPSGAILKTKGGRASGPQPLKDMLNFARNRIFARQGRKLRPIDAHDIMCAVGNAAVSGGMRRTAMIALFDFDDQEMRDCKSGNFERENSQRWNANNSVVISNDSMSQQEVMKLMMDMADSGRGEPGIFSRSAALATMPKRRKPVDNMGTNPCGEILLRPMQFCNLSIAVARKNDTLDDLMRKVKVATIIGTIQSMATDFKGLRPEWKENCEEERLLGVDITGQRDCSILNQKDSHEIFARLRDYAVVVNKEYAETLGINQSASVTCVKPSGNSSQLFDCSAGLHARWSPYYIRNIRVSTHSPLFSVLRDAGVPMDPENGQTREDADTWVIHFPVDASHSSMFKNQVSALEQCKFWKTNKVFWTEHNPSVTITYKPDELMYITKWVYDNQSIVGGMAFLPAFDAKYQQMPFEEIDEKTYYILKGAFPSIDFSKLYRYEEEDYTTAAQELACMAGACEFNINEIKDEARIGI